MVAELGQTTDPRALVPGDPGAVDKTQASLTAYGDLLQAAGEGLAKISTGDGWSGPAADQFHKKFGGKPAKWTEAGEAFHAAAGALVGYVDSLTAAQDQAGQAIELWNQGEAATTGARAEHDQAVNQAQQDAAAKSAAGSPTVAPVIPFVDAGEVKRAAARALLDRARGDLRSAGDGAEKLVDAWRDKAPQLPGFWEDVGDWLSDAGGNVLDLVEQAGAGLLNAMASMGNAAIHHPGDLAATVGGFGLMVLGATGEVGGGILDATIVLAPVGAAINVGSAVVIGAGAGLAGVGLHSMAKHAAGDDAVEPVQAGGGSSGSSPGGGMLGENGTKISGSKTLLNKDGARLDLENPAPGVRPGQVHYQDRGGAKYLYNFTTGQFEGMPGGLARRLAQDPAFVRAIQKSQVFLGLP